MWNPYLFFKASKMKQQQTNLYTPKHKHSKEINTHYLGINEQLYLVIIMKKPVSDLVEIRI